MPFEIFMMMAPSLQHLPNASSDGDRPLLVIDRPDPHRRGNIGRNMIKKENIYEV